MRAPTRAAVALGAALGIATFAAGALAQDPVPPGTVPPGQPPPPPPAYPANMQAGGLAPPAGTPPPAGTAPGPTEQHLDKSKKEDSGRGLEWFWLNAEGGLSHVDLRTFVGNEDFTFGFVDSQATGGMVGAGIGARLVFVTIGARGRIGFFDPWQMFTVGGELGLKIPIGRVDIAFALGGGYAALGNVNALVDGARDAISIQGGYVRANGGLDVYITPVFSVGLMASADFLAMVRPGLSLAQVEAIKADPSLTSAQRLAADGLGLEGSSFGMAAGLTGVLGLHF